MTYPVPTAGHTEAPIVVNFKVPEIPGSPMLTLRANQGVELEALSADVARHGVTLGRSLTEFRAGILAGAGVQLEAPSQAAPAAQPQYQAQPAQPAYQSAPQAPQTGATGPAPSCPHGVKEYKSGVGKTGKPYKMWACPSRDRNNQCPPEWV